MLINEYQEKASLTINNNKSDSELIEQATFGLAAEVGKLALIVNSERFRDLDIVEEKRGEFGDIIGDILWYVSEIATASEIHLSDTLTHNLAKTKMRYPDRAYKRIK